MLVSEIQLYNILKTRLGEKEAETLVQFIDSKLSENNEQNLKVVATREDIANLKGELLTKMSENKVDMVKWVFATFFAIMLAIVGLYFRH